MYLAYGFSRLPGLINLPFFVDVHFRVPVAMLALCLAGV